MKQNEWQEKSLEEVTKIIMGQSPDSKTYNFEDNGTPFLQGCADFKSLYPDTNTFCSNPVKMAPEQSILFSVRAPVGEINLSDKEYCIGRGLASIVPDKVDTQFLFYALKLNRNKFSNLGQGSTFEAIDSKTLKEFKLKIPQVSEQQKIAEILTTVDNTIEKTEQIIEKYKKVKEGMMQDLFTRGIDENGNLRPSYKQAPHLYKETELGMIPKEWELCLSSNFCTSIADGTHETPKPKESGIPLFTSKNLTDYNKLDKTEYYLISEEDAKHINKRSYVEKYDILFGMIGTVGNPVIIQEESNFAVKNVGIFRFNGNKLKSEWFYYALNSKQVQNYFDAILNGSTQKFISLDVLRNFYIPVPSDNEELYQITQILKHIDYKIDKEVKHLSKLQKLKQGLMQDLLTGKVRVKV